MSLLRSNLWPVAAYAVMALWLVVINHTHLGLDFHFTAETFSALSQLDSVVHFTTALALAAAFSQVRGARWTVPRLLALVLVWEAAEALVVGYVSPRVFSQPGRLGLLDLVYLFDTLDDIALGVAGTLVGAYFTKPLSSPGAMED